MRRTGAVALATGALLLVAGGRLLPSGAPPLYDGLCLVNPYQYSSPPPATSTERPTSATKDLDVSGGQPGTELITGETPPQATLELGDGALAVPSGVSRLSLRIRPIAAPADPPPDGRLDGNVYHVEVTTPEGLQVPLASGRTAEVLLRPETAGAGTRALERYEGGRWIRLDTAVMTCAETQAAVTTRLGDFAVIDIGSGGGDGGGGSPVIWLVGGAVLAVASIIVLIRVSRLRRRPPARPRRNR